MTTSVLPTLLITPRRAALLAGHDNELDVLVRVQAPNAPTEQPSRHPLHLALVIDRSGSMSGPPLAEAKRCADFVLDGLMPQRVPADRSMRIVAVRPGGSVEPLVWLHGYDSRFAHPFLFRKPLSLPPGTVISGIPADAAMTLLPLTAPR